MLRRAVHRRNLSGPAELRVPAAVWRRLHVTTAVASLDRSPRRNFPELSMRKMPVLTLGLLLAGSRCFAAPAAADAIDIPFEKFRLSNGLTVVVHEDRKAPVVAVGVWYHVGSKDERPGKTGFAHLFEHLMFQGSENFRDEFFRPLEQVGATDRNGTTNADRTNYFETVPTTALDMTLWLESDRM